MAKFIWGERKIITLLSLVVIFSVILNVVLIYITAEGKMNVKTVGNSETSVNCLQSVNAIRQNEFELCKPLLLVNIPNESEDLYSIKEKIKQFIDHEKSLNKITTASVYLKYLNNGSWMSLNADEKYFPASMYKEVVLISFLKYAELHPGLLDEKILFNSPQVNQRDIRNEGEYLEVGKLYNYRELLRRMIINSDNESANLLVNRMGRNELQKLNDYLMIPGDGGSIDFQITITNMSKYLRVLYNSTYLTVENSEFALELLSQSRYNEGIAKYISKSITVVHKFGERNIASDPQLHESAIIYFKGNPVLLTIMTKGPDYNLLSEEIAEMSKLVMLDIMAMNQN